MFKIPELEELVGTNPYRPWTGEEESVIRAYYGRVPTKRLAEYLDRTLSSVQNKAQRMGLRRGGYE